MDISTEKTANTSWAVSKIALLTMALLMFSALSTPALADYMKEKIDARVVELTRQLNNGHAGSAQQGYDALKNKYGHYASMQELGKALAGDNFVAIADGKCVKDKTTGLIWERKTNSGLRDKDHTYTWYSRANNGGDAGWKDEYDWAEIEGDLGESWAPKYRGAACGGTLKACNTSDYVKAFNRQGLYGYKNWRLPTKRELMSIVYKRKSGCSKKRGSMKTGGCINTNVFPNTAINTSGNFGWYWSSSPHANYNSFAWFVPFYSSDDGALGKYFNFYVRLVRSGQ